MTPLKPFGGTVHTHEKDRTSVAATERVGSGVGALAPTAIVTDSQTEDLPILGVAGGAGDPGVVLQARPRTDYFTAVWRISPSASREQCGEEDTAWARWLRPTGTRWLAGVAAMHRGSGPSPA